MVTHHKGLIPESHMTLGSHGLARSHDKLKQDGNSPGRMVTHLDGLLLKISLAHLIKWSCETTWHAKTIISLLSQVPMATKPGRTLTYLERHPFTKLLGSLVKLSCKIMQQTKTIISLLSQCLYGHSICPDADFPWEVPTHKVIRAFGHVVVEDHTTN